MLDLIQLQVFNALVAMCTVGICDWHIYDLFGNYNTSLLYLFKVRLDHVTVSGWSGFLSGAENFKK